MNAPEVSAVDWIGNVDSPGGIMDTVIEHLQLEPFDVSQLMTRDTSEIDNAKRMALHLPYGRLIAFSVFDEQVSSESLVMIANQLPTGAVLMVFLSDYVNPMSANIITRYVPAETPAEFILKIAGHVHKIISTQPIGSRFNPPQVDFPELQKRYVEIENYEPLLDERHAVKLEMDSVDFDFFSDLRSGSRKLVVFGQDAINRDITPLPHFYRWSWLPRLEASAIILNDPSLYARNDLLAGWWVGTQSRDYLKEAVGIISKIASALDIENHDITFFGASAGGYSALAMASCLPGSRAIVDIPQVCLETYGAKVASDASIKAGLNFDSAELVPEKFRHRIDLIERFISEQWVPDFLYLQNNRDHTHVGAQMGPFLARLGALMSKHRWAQCEFVVEMYSAWNLLKGGHFPLSREVTLRRINEYIVSPKARSRS
ncbi:hypothetical protein [Pseudarthrobacter raffinosi]|uniref:hypothetical protein n=1 Tax=Pseudarthrobacter raffinosi TaxID=2953651 RepID=UPI00208E4A6E|nr:hypothetical protein [Pseudarthrobacter sp. MDT3-28]MCO4239835.1 hypothetical protein [Pseudarthrobacter sp. MDT3-28]